VKNVNDGRLSTLSTLLLLAALIVVLYLQWWQTGIVEELVGRVDALDELEQQRRRPRRASKPANGAAS
jgi:hypothetical protein